MLLFGFTFPILITDDDLFSLFLLLSHWLLNETVFALFIRRCVVVLQKKFLKKQVKQKKDGKHKKEGKQKKQVPQIQDTPEIQVKPKKATAVPRLIDKDDSSYAPTCESTDHSGHEGTPSGVLTLPSSEELETRWPGKKINFGTVTNVVLTAKPPQIITIETPTTAQGSLSSGSSVSSSTSSLASEESWEPGQVPGSLERAQTKDGSSRKSSLKSKTPMTGTQTTSFRREDRPFHFNWKPKPTRPDSNFGRERVPFKNLNRAHNI